MVEAQTFNGFFSNIVKNLEYKCENDLSNRFSSDPVLKAIMKYRNHPVLTFFLNITAVQDICTCIFVSAHQNMSDGFYGFVNSV